MAEAIVEHDYSAKQPDELTIKKGDVIKEVNKKQEGWCEGLLDGKKGLFPDNFVMIVQVNMRTNSSNLRKCKVVYSYKQEHEDELSLNIGEVIEIVGEEEEGWWKGRLNGKVGVFPSNFVEEIKAPINDESTLIEDIAPKIKEETKPSKILCEVKYAYQAQNSDELTLKEGDIVTLISKDGQDDGWWRGELDGKMGVFPDNFVAIIENTDVDKTDKAIQPNNEKPVHVASQRRSQEVKGIKLPINHQNSIPPTFTGSTTTSTSTTTGGTASPPAIPNKKPSIPFKKSPSGSGGGLFSSITGLTRKLADTIDGGASSKSVKIVNDVENSKEGLESYHAFDQVERNPVLQDPRANRVKAPGRRPPSVALKEGEVVINGNSDYGSLEDAPLDNQENQAEIKPKSLECQKPPWLDEMNKKMINKRTTPPPPEKVNRLEASTNSIDDNKSMEVSPNDMTKSLPPTMFSQPRKFVDKPEVKPPIEMERSTSMERPIHVDKEKVVMRSKPSVNVRPQSIDAPSRPIAKTSPTIHKSPSPSPSPVAMGKPPIADRSSLEVISSRHFNDLSERIASLEVEMQRQREEFRTAMEDLRGRLQVETDMRMQLQVELEKMQMQV